MKVCTKEELELALKELRKGKDNQENYNYTPPSMAMCYSMGFPRYHIGHFIGKHKCVNCGTDFGTDMIDEISLCQQKRYEEYLKSKYLFFYEYPCFNEFYEKYNKKNSELFNFLFKNNLTFENHNKYSDYAEYRHSPMMRFDESEKVEGVESFNRLLTKEEWVKLNTNCKQHKCFELDYFYETYKTVCEKYKEAGYDVRLEYNCPDCCLNDKSAIEFWFRFNNNDNYVISRPARRDDNNVSKYTSYSDYMIVLEFLKGCNTYQELLKKSFNRDGRLKKSQIDNALNKIVGTNIKYDKNEIKRYIKQFYKPLTYNESEVTIYQNKEAKQKQIAEENKVISCIINIFDNILSLYDDMYQFSMTEFNTMINTVDEIKGYGYKFDKLSLESRAEIVEKRAMLKLKGIDSKISTNTIYEYWRKAFPEGERITEKTRPYQVELSRKQDKIHYITFNFLELIFDMYGKDFQISMSLFDRLVDLFGEDFQHEFKLENAEEIENSLFSKTNIQNIVEGK